MSGRERSRSFTLRSVDIIVLLLMDVNVIFLIKTVSSNLYLSIATGLCRTLRIIITYLLFITSVCNVGALLCKFGLHLSVIDFLSV